MLVVNDYVCEKAHPEETLISWSRSHFTSKANQSGTVEEVAKELLASQWWHLIFMAERRGVLVPRFGVPPVLAQMAVIHAA